MEIVAGRQQRYRRRMGDKPRRFDDCFWRILLKKSFWESGRNFSKPLVR
jgi:hypothetical protein